MIGRGEHMKVRTYIEQHGRPRAVRQHHRPVPGGRAELQALPLQRPRLGDELSTRWCPRTTASAPTSSATCCAAGSCAWCRARTRRSTRPGSPTATASATRACTAPTACRRRWCAAARTGWRLTGRARSLAVAEGLQGAARRSWACSPAAPRRSRSCTCCSAWHAASARNNIDHRLRAARLPRPGGRSGLPRPRACPSPRSMHLDALLVIGSQPAPRGADPGAPRAQGRTGAARRWAS